ncbi:MAG: bifunctional hydroxymethylpyrimidine kinase/phosphomethylpyrimidine kinase [Alphaproteobacteria bacterium]
MTQNILSIAGSDPSGGAGIQADLKTFSALGCYGMAAITALTAQNTTGVSGVHEVPHDFLGEQIQSIFSDIQVHALKIGMAGNVRSIGVISEMIQRHNPVNIVLDPVMVATSGDKLLSAEAVDALRRQLVPLADMITPNIPEAEILLGKTLSQHYKHDMEDMARDLLQLGCKSVVLKGGHLHGPSSDDVFCDQDGNTEILHASRVKTNNTHGTGCTLSSALACYLAKGLPPLEAAHAAKKYLSQALGHADDLRVGCGKGPVHHFYNFWN